MIVLLPCLSYLVLSTNEGSLIGYKAQEVTDDTVVAVPGARQTVEVPASYGKLLNC